MPSTQCTSSTSNTVGPRRARARCTASNTRTGSTGVDSREASNSKGLMARGISARSAPSNRCEAANATSRSGSNPAISMTASGPARDGNSAMRRDLPDPGSPSTMAAAASALSNASLKRARSAVSSEERPKSLPGTELRLGPRVVRARSPSTPGCILNRKPPSNPGRTRRDPQPAFGASRRWISRKQRVE